MCMEGLSFLVKIAEKETYWGGTCQRNNSKTTEIFETPMKIQISFFFLEKSYAKKEGHWILM